MSKRLNVLNGTDFIRMVEMGAEQLRQNADKVNALNVFPVPDGDTGTNMNLTFTSGVEELRRRPSSHIGKAAEALAKGLLMGARGNSGVILSQLFRGFAKSVANMDEVNAEQLAAAFQQGVDMAYKAVVKPVEGTILSVAKEAAKQGVHHVKRHSDIQSLMNEIQNKATEALAHTPEQLPVLKQVGVVDAGGQGLLYIYNGFVHALSDADIDMTYTVVERVPSSVRYLAVPPKVIGRASNNDKQPGQHEPVSAQAKLATEDIVYGYCTEFMVTLNAHKTKARPFEEHDFRERLSAFGDSLLVVSDDDLVRVHIHAEYPGTVMNAAMEYGELSRIKIENMRDQHTHILMEELELAEQSHHVDDTASASLLTPHVLQEAVKLKRFGFVAISAGTGISGIFKSLGVDQVIHGGQSMNPSTEDIVQAVNQIDALTVFVLPNNSNILLAAEQAVQLIEGKTLVVIPTHTIPQGIAAMIAFQENEEPEINVKLMQQAADQVESGAVTYAVRDTTLDDLDIKQGDYIGLHNNKIMTADKDLLTACSALIDSLLASGGEVVTIYTGEEANEEQSQQLVQYIEQTYSDVEVEIHRGGQPVYFYIVSAE
ncbi:DAK2 domain-containing protein [Paenibacillus periandrae]|uniref:DAK2 domain-containing protein n=1 Tax=Paenibacillus periandrae TaxID=1761741 RepID=UPI001F091E5C|nr:DAK2 domain-containing protein [Paenibacillus periandrae]